MIWIKSKIWKCIEARLSITLLDELVSRANILASLTLVGCFVMCFLFHLIVMLRFVSMLILQLSLCSDPQSIYFCRLGWFLFCLKFMTVHEVFHVDTYFILGDHLFRLPDWAFSQIYSNPNHSQSLLKYSEWFRFLSSQNL